MTDELLQQARAEGERTKALEASKMKTPAAKIQVKKTELVRPKRELFCKENLQEIEESLLGPDEPEPSTVDETVEDARLAEGIGATTARNESATAESANFDESFLEEENAESFMEE